MTAVEDSALKPEDDAAQVELSDPARTADDPAGPEKPTVAAAAGRGFAIERASWESIRAYAADQAAEAAAGRGPKRTIEIEERYSRYKRWCEARGHTGVELVLATAAWQRTTGETSVRVALEFNIVPYHLPDGVEHWVLWYHPDDTDPKTELPREACEAGANECFGGTLVVGDELIAFQNLPEFRSVPEVAHAHVFLRPRDETNAATLVRLRRDRCLRSPWAEHERLGGRGHEIGFV